MGKSVAGINPFLIHVLNGKVPEEGNPTIPVKPKKKKGKRK